MLNEPQPQLGEPIELRLQSAAGTLLAEATFTDLRDDPVMRGVVCNFRHSERLARLRERERLNASAHADILQVLFGASLELAAAGMDIENASDRVQAADTLINDAMRALRRLLGPDEEPDGAG